MRKVFLILLVSLTVSSAADACGPLGKLRAAAQARRQPRTATTCQAVTASQPAPQYRTTAAPTPVLMTGPVVTAVRQCAGGVCPR